MPIHYANAAGWVKQGLELEHYVLSNSSNRMSCSIGSNSDTESITEKKAQGQELADLPVV